jgi:hypothetical protein
MEKVSRKELQTDKYDYTWSRDKGDGEYTGITDRQRIDKDEGYEVLYFIEVMVNKHEMNPFGVDVRSIEDALHDPDLSDVVMRDVLIRKIEKMLFLSI